MAQFTPQQKEVYQSLRLLKTLAKGMSASASMPFGDKDAYRRDLRKFADHTMSVYQEMYELLGYPKGGEVL